MKKAKYFIEFSANETLESLPIEITKKAFNQHLAEYRKQADEHANEDEEDYISAWQKVNEGKKARKTLYFFAWGCSDIVLTEWKCKEGYCFEK